MDNKWPRLSRGSLIHRAEEFLTRYILSGEVAPGDYLPTESVLCRKLGIGRSTLRETVGILESKGLVERRHGVGVRVIDRSQQAASGMLQLMIRRRRAPGRDLLEMRRLYEVQAAAWAAERADRGDLLAIESALDAMRAAQTRPTQYAEADLQFHMAVAKAAHNAVLALIVETLRALLRNAILASLKADYRPARSLKFHERVFEAVREHGPAKASRAMSDHLDETEAMLRRVAKNR
jgi:GntR family transcriptional repressor for pyruvate dehydrogenase complex